MLSFSDIVFVLSGGSTNTDPLQSLGGASSTTPVNTRLFNNLAATQTEGGYTDYRCLYIANDSDTDTLTTPSLYVDNQAAGGVDIQLGFMFQNDVQQVSVSSGLSVTGGSFTLQYESTSFTVAWASNIATWAANFQSAIAAVAHLEDVTVAGAYDGTTAVFTVTFAGTADSRYHPLLTVVSDSGLTPIGGGHVSVIKIFDGGPLNSVTTQTDVVTTAPNGILFGKPTLAQPLILNDMRPADFLPVWIRRVCPAGQPVLEGDGFRLVISPPNV